MTRSGSRTRCGRLWSETDDDLSCGAARADDRLFPSRRRVKFVVTYADPASITYAAGGSPAAGALHVSVTELPDDEGEEMQRRARGSRCGHADGAGVYSKRAETRRGYGSRETGREGRYRRSTEARNLHPTHRRCFYIIPPLLHPSGRNSRGVRSARAKRSSSGRRRTPTSVGPRSWKPTDR
jgi:hypothetical protein